MCIFKILFFVSNKLVDPSHSHIISLFSLLRLFFLNSGLYTHVNVFCFLKLISCRSLILCNLFFLSKKLFGITNNSMSAFAVVSFFFFYILMKFYYIYIHQNKYRWLNCNFMLKFKSIYPYFIKLQNEYIIKKKRWASQKSTVKNPD